MTKIGIDMDKVEKFNLDRNSSFIKNNFTLKEIDYAFSKSSPKETLCGLFCAKEAIIKALDRQDVLLREIEISWDSSGRPIAKILKNGISAEGEFSISISHSGEYAVAMALRKKNDE
jgi:holo-[acyl-carrier protein] synthase